MADEQQLALIKQGTGAWNEWRKRNPSTKVDLIEAALAGADLTRADLTDAALRNANLRRTDLTGANLHRADLTHAYLVEAELRDASLSEAIIYGATLTGANLAGATLIDGNLSAADLRGAKLVAANLSTTNLSGTYFTETNLNFAKLAHANLTGAFFQRTVLGGVDLSQARGLDSIIHLGSSILDHRTLELSGPLPLSFLRGCGLPDRLIDYLPSLLNAGPIQFYSVFISYSTANEAFANRLHADLQDRGVRCWFAPHDMQGGKKIHDQIDAAIRIYDRLLLILSSESMSSRWVKTEIEKAREKEVSLKRDVLFPVALVPFSEIRPWKQFNADLGEDTARTIREYFVPDFSGWETDHGKYLASFEKLLASLNSADARSAHDRTAGQSNDSTDATGEAPPG